MAEGFRVARSFVEVGVELDDSAILRAAQRASDRFDSSLLDGVKLTGQRMSRELEQAGTRAGESMGAAITDQVTKTTATRLRDSRGRFVKAGQDAGEDMGSGAGRGLFAMLRRLMPDGIGKAVQSFGADLGKVLPRVFSVSGPAGVALAPAAFALGSWAGATMAAGMALGLSGGAVFAGVLLALKDPEIKNAAAETSEDIGDRLKRAAEPFKGSMLGMLALARSSFARWEPDIQRIFARAATFLEPLTAGLMGMVSNMLPGIRRLIDQAGPLVTTFAQGLSRIGDAIGDMFASLADNGPEMTMALTAAMGLLEFTIRAAGSGINFLTESFGVFLDLALNGLNSLTPILQAIASAGIPGISALAGELAGKLGPAIAETKQGWQEWKGRLKEAGPIGVETTRSVTTQTDFMRLSMAAAIREAGGLSAAFKMLNGGALSAREAESAYQAAIDNVTASIKQNGHTLDLNTAKGRANDAAIRQLIGSIDAKANATYEHIKATQGETAAQEAAAKVYEEGRRQLVKSLTQILGNKEAAEKLANQIYKIPKQWGTNVTMDDSDARAGATWVRKTIKDLNGKTITIKVKMETHGSLQGEHIIGKGTQLKYAEGGPVVGGSGSRDDVPVLAMGGEWFIRKGAVRALERDFGPDFLPRLNWWDRGGRGPVQDVRPAGGVAPAPAPAPGSVGSGQSIVYQFAPGSVVLDASKLRTIQDVVELIGSLRQSARMVVA
ncbi:MAG TPA: hypothetical protein VFU47_12935 [Armatimonadota bacterium]|nr:hypothetical protein [Armatimonadota bacterium]